MRHPQRLVTIDALNGLGNQRSFDTRLHDSCQMQRRAGRSFCLILIDIDHFKKINDRHGHPRGDAVLRELAQRLTQSTLGTDFVAPYGGEEFAVLVPDIRQDTEGVFVADKIRGSVAAHDFAVVGHITVSPGLSFVHPTDQLPAQVLERADQAPYAAKELGRNRVVSL